MREIVLRRRKCKRQKLLPAKAFGVGRGRSFFKFLISAWKFMRKHRPKQLSKSSGAQKLRSSEAFCFI